MQRHMPMQYKPWVNETLSMNAIIVHKLKAGKFSNRLTNKAILLRMHNYNRNEIETDAKQQ